jgi:hypothetical protein
VLKSNVHNGFRHSLSMTLAVSQCALAVLYLFPGLMTPAAPTTTRIALELARVVPIWTVSFGLTGLAVIAGLSVHKLLHVAHAATASSWIGFAFVLELSAWANHGTHLLPFMAASLAAVNLVIAGNYSRDVGREEPRR